MTGNLKCLVVFFIIGMLWIPSNSIAEVNPSHQVVMASEVKWTALNPARGSKGPRAANLWGDRTKGQASGFLVKFVDGFSSPPHIHNVSYRALVIDGLVHNDDPDANTMWMSSGSYWTQPAGEVHITSAKGKNNLIYVEIGNGPYLVNPVEQSFDNGERPVNITGANLVWLDASTTKWIDSSSLANPTNGPKLAFLWGAPREQHASGTLLKLPSGLSVQINTRKALLRAVTLKGQLEYTVLGEPRLKSLEPGSYFSSKGKSFHQLSSSIGEESLIYINASDSFLVKVVSVSAAQ